MPSGPPLWRPTRRLRRERRGRSRAESLRSIVTRPAAYLSAIESSGLSGNVNGPFLSPGEGPLEILPPDSSTYELIYTVLEQRNWIDGRLIHNLVAHPVIPKGLAISDG